MKPHTTNLYCSFLYLIIASLVTSCSSPLEMPTAQTLNNGSEQSDKCIGPVYENFAYPIKADDPNLSYPGLDLFIPPPHPWQVVSPIPEIDGMNDWRQQFVNVIQTRRVNEHFEIWVYLSRGLEEGYLAVYRTDTKEWQVLPQRIKTLIVDKNGSLWGSYFDGSVLSKYDEQTDIFISEKSTQGLPSVVKEDNSYSYSQILLDKDGMFWILIPKDGIYKFNPITSNLSKAFDIHDTFGDAKIAPDGTIFVLFNEVTYQGDTPQVSYLLKFFETVTGKEGEYALGYFLEPYPMPLTILIDSKGSIWLDNIAFIEDRTIYQIQRSPVFLSPVRESFNDYRYKRADVILESSDGRIWFLHQNNGMISLDPEKNEWCWFTTYQSNIVEDSERNLWMIADGKLYKLALGK